MTQPMQEGVTAVIPAYNEEDHVGEVLQALRAASLLTHIIVVDDASTDETAAVVRAAQQQDGRVRLLPLARNRGKGGAMLAGAEASETDMLVFLDADLMNLEVAHVEALVAPVYGRRCSMTLGIFKDGRIATDWSHRYFSFLSGQRCLRWSHFKATPAMADARWSVEMALNLYAWRQQYAVEHVAWRGVTHVMRGEKRLGLRGYLSHVHMWLDISKYIARHFVLDGCKTSVQTMPLVGRKRARKRRDWAKLIKWN